MIRFGRIVTVLVGLGLLAASSTRTQAASSSNTSPATASAIHVAGDPARSPSALPFGAPSGCPSGAVCFYRSGNGGDLCGIWYDDAPSLHECKAYSVYNNGTSNDVNLYFGSSYTGAWYCLPKGNYLLYMDLNQFNQGMDLPGYHKPMADQVASAKWTSC